MKSSTFNLAALVVCALMLSAPLFAHHGTAIYDSKHPVTVTGTVTEYKFANPHILLYWDVKDADGKVTPWIAEIGAPNNIYRSAGWTKNTIKVGDTVTVTGSPSKTGSKTMISGPEKILVNGKKLLPEKEGERAGGNGG